MRYYGPSADHGPITDSNPSLKCIPRTDPHIRSDFHWRCYTRLFIDPAIDENPVVVICHKTAWRNHRMIANHNAAT